MRQLLASILLPTAILISAAAWAETDMDQLRSLLLYPHSTIELTHSDLCGVIQNTSDALVVVPLSPEAWMSFNEAQYPFVNVKECARS